VRSRLSGDEPGGSVERVVGGGRLEFSGWEFVLPARDATTLVSMSTDTILVTGGTGKIGSAFVSLLAADASAPVVRVATRDPSAPGARLMRALNPATVVPTAFEVDKPDSLKAAFEGVTRLFVIAPFVPDMAAWHGKVAEAARSAGVTYAVKVSVTGARAPGGDPAPGRIPLSHWQGEQALLSAGLSATMIRPTIFMQHFLTVPALYAPRADRFFLPTGPAKVAWLDCRDIAAAAAALITASPEKRAPFEGKAFELTGPQALTAAEVSEILSWVARRTISHVDGVEAFSAHAQELGVPDTFKGIYGEAAGGWFGAVDTTLFTKLLGRTTTPFARFALDAAAQFGSAAGD
jgi:uncharacterized protein YbjT (DUF2867 family)